VSDSLRQSHVPFRGGPERFVENVNSLSGLFRQHEQRQTQESIMPVLLVPFLIGVPVVLGGGYIIYHLVH
jgi:hypothetical protein